MTTAAAPAFHVGFVGAGHIAEFHARGLARISEARLVGITDLDAAKAAELGARHGTPALPSLAALREAGANVIHVLTPPHTHAQVAADALALGCHVFVEKPLATDVDDCARLDRMAQDKGLSLGVCHSMLYDPQIESALAKVRAGVIGDVVSVDILRTGAYPPAGAGPTPPQYRSAGYPFRDLGIHALYLIEAFLGPIAGVDATWTSLGGDPNLAFDEWRAVVRCKKGVGQFQLSWNVKPLQQQVIIQGTRGVLRADVSLMFNALRKATPLPKPAERIVNALTDLALPLGDVARNVVGFATGRVRQYHGVQECVADFYRALSRGARPPVSVADALSAVRFTEQVARAADADFEARRAKLTTTGPVDVLVTGASGGLGSAVVERLRAEGAKVRVMVRRLPETPPPGVTLALGDLGDAEAVSRAVAGARAVIHVGAAMKGAWPEHERATVAGTANVIEACRRHGIDKLVHISSLSVVDWAGAAEGAPITEDSPLEPRAAERGAYTRAKLEAEERVLAAARAGLPAVIIRPGLIFGGRIPILKGGVARRLGPAWLELGDGEIPLPLVYIDDVVDGVLAALRGPLRGGEVVQLVDPDSRTQNQVLAAMVGSDAKVVRIPRWLIFGAAGASERLLGLAGRTSPASTYRFRSGLAKRSFTSARAGQMLGWAPRVGVAEGLRRAAADLAAEKPTGGVRPPRA